MIEIKSLVKNLSAALVFKIGAIALGVITIPAYLSYFDEKATLGVWFTILAVLNWILFFDLGLGNGMKNQLIAAIENKNYSNAKSLIYKTYVILCLVSIVLMIVLFVCYYNFSGLILSGEMVANGKGSMDTIILLLSVMLLIQFPLRLTVSILLSMQKSGLASFIPFATQCLVLVYLLVSFNTQVEYQLTFLTAVYGISICFPLILTSFYIYFVIKKWPVGKVDYKNFSGGAGLIFSGSKFFWIQLCLLVINGSNEFLVLKFHSPENVVLYQVYFKVFSVFLVVFSAVTVPLWSAISQANASNDYKRISDLDRFMKLLMFMVLIGMIVLCIILQPLFNLWLGNDVISSDLSTSMLFSGYMIVMIGINYSACISNGYNQLQKQLKFLSFAVLIKFSGLYFYSSYAQGWTDIVLLTIISLVPAFCFQIYDANKLMYGSTVESKTIINIKVKK